MKLYRHIPKSIEVCGVQYTVVDVDEIDGGDTCGECQPEQTRIVLARHASRECKYHTFKHECGHAVWVESGMREMLKRYIPKAKDRKDLEEQVCLTLLPAYGAIK